MKPSSRLYLITFLTEALVLSSMAATLKFAATYWGPDGFGEYILARRTIGWLQLPLLAGVNVAVTRCVAIARTGRGRVTEEAYVAGATISAALCGSVALIILNLFPERIGYLLLGSTREASLVRGMSIALAAALMQGIVYGWLCGRMQMGAANTVQLINLGIVPLAVFSVDGLTVPRAIGIIGALWFVVPVCAVGPFLWRSWRQNHEPPKVRSAIGELMTYGCARVPGDLVLGALFALPVIFAAHWSGSTDAGFVGLGVSLLSMAGSVFSPLGQILLPSATTMVASQGTSALRHQTRKLIVITIAVAVVAAAGLEIGATALMNWFFGQEFVPAIPFVRVIAIGIIPYAVYVVMRNFLDAVRVMPLNGKNLVIALAAFLIIALARQTALATAVAFCCAMGVLGALTLFDSARELQKMRYNQMLWIA